jgi:hypothetical protein
MTMLEHALRLADMGFWVFRLKPRGKTPLYNNWQAEATRDKNEIIGYWTNEPHANIGIFCSRFGDFMALIAVDEDNKDGRDGAGTMCQLEFDGQEFPTTYIQTTPTGGRHHVYIAKRSVNQGNANVLGRGVDLRSRGGYIVGSGSFVDGKTYTDNGLDIVEVPGWLFDLRDAPEAPKIDTQQHSGKINAEAADKRAMRYLEAYAPTAEDGERNGTAYKVAARIKDFGVLEDACQSLMADWNGALENPLEDDELERTVRSAYKTGANAVGALAAEVLFDNVVDAPDPRPKKKVVEEEDDEAEAVRHPVDWLNNKHAICMAGGGHHILWETTDNKGVYKLEHLQEHSFHRMHAHLKIAQEGGDKPVTQIWMEDAGATRYDGLVFAPGQEVNKRFFNLWRGFAFEPKTRDQVSARSIRAVEEFFIHARENVCNNDPKQFKYLISFFAFTVQYPHLKPLVALVFKGEKGVGKNALIQIIGKLFGSHHMVTAKKRYLTSNFNGHLEALKWFILDEAFWSGDKDAEGVLKDLITGTTHTIERKGQEIYEVANLLALAILGNENWLVPASHDERRYFVASVNNNRKQDNNYFEEMRLGMEDGGYELLLRTLMDWDLTGFEINKPPMTQGLTEQKLKTLDIMGNWWYDTLRFGKIAGAYNHLGFTQIGEVELRNAFFNYCRNRNVRTRLPDNITFHDDLLKYAPSLARMDSGSGACYTCTGGLDVLRKDFDNYIKGEIKWLDISNTQEEDVMS